MPLIKSFRINLRIIVMEEICSTWTRKFHLEVNNLQDTQKAFDTEGEGSYKIQCRRDK